MQEHNISRWGKIKRFLRESRRVIAVTKKPDRMEFTTIVKVTSLGIAVIGLMGFLISMAKQVLLS
ncbi:MAG: protein translocase SEC61 complex subunit gamma [Nanoarchaeota archaeon]|nr:protein translocase SEC61 complex subunit gamma [Nanoarchaeota archaeon]